jgi:phage-related minor tail protein
MAQTIDNVTLKINVEGKAAIDQTTASLDKSSAAATRTKQSFGGAGQGVSNFGFQIQDMAVQLEMGTDALRVMGQQLPQMLSGFGLFGIAVGTLAAVGIPLFRVGMEAMGKDMRNLNEMMQDLRQSTQNYNEAQRANQPTLQGLGNSYGALTNEAKSFFEVQQKLTEKKAYLDLSATLQQVRKDFGFLTDEVVQAGTKGNEAMVKMFGETLAATPAKMIIQAKLLGLNVEQARELGNRLKDIDANAPEKTLTILTETANWLGSSNIEASKQKKIFDEVITPLMAINNLILEQNKQIKESAVSASRMATEIYNMQAAFIPRIGSARRSFDQITAARLEGEMKVAEFRKQAEEKSAQDGVSRAAEIAAFTNRTNAETKQKVLDIRNAQEEAYKSAERSNEARSRALALESQILTIKSNMRGQLAYEVSYSEDVAKAAKDRADALVSISDQARKNQITEARAAELRANVYEAEQKQVDLAKQRRDYAIEEARIKQESSIIELSNKNSSTQLDIQAAQLLQQNRTVYPEILESQNRINKLKDDAVKAEAAINREVALGNISRADADARIAKTNEGLTLALELEKLRNAEFLRRKTGTAEQGAEDAIVKILQEGMSAYEQAGAAVNSVFNSMNSAIDSFVSTGKFKFSDFARSIIADLIKIELKAVALNFLGALFPGLGAKLKLPGKAVGGPVMPRTAYMVGERGPEMFIPNGAGSIVPNHAMGGGAQVTYNIQAVDARSFKELVARDPEFIYSVTQVGARRIPR